MNKKLRAGSILLATFLVFCALTSVALAAPAQPELTMTHTAEKSRVLVELTARIPAAEEDDSYEGDWQTGLTVFVQMAEDLVVDADSVQAVYQMDDGESYTLGRNYWDAKGRQFLVGVSAGGDRAGQLLCRFTADAASGRLRGTMINVAQMTVEYTDRMTGEVVQTTAEARDQETFGRSLTLDPAGGILSNRAEPYLWQEDLEPGQQINLADLPKPARDGYLFDGWTLRADSGGRLESGSLIMGEGNAVLQASWLSRQDKLTLDLNGGSGRVVTVSGLIGEDVTVPNPSSVLYSKDGFKLAGWTDTPDGTGGKHYIGGELYRLTREDDVLYAWWAPMYTITYDANGGTGQMPRRIFASSDKVIAEECIFQRQGYSFAGWSRSADGRGSRYESGESVPLNENITLYAQWEKVYAAPAAEENDGTGLILALVIAGVAAVCVAALVLALRRHRREQDVTDWEDIPGEDWDRNPEDWDDTEAMPYRRDPRDRD